MQTRWGARAVRVRGLWLQFTFTSLDIPAVGSSSSFFPPKQLHKYLCSITQVHAHAGEDSRNNGVSATDALFPNPQGQTANRKPQSAHIPILMGTNVYAYLRQPSEGSNV